jgi:DUF1707 SHOCT-like domain
MPEITTGRREGAVSPAPGDAAMRASDADRERVVELLRDHCAAGRLTSEELSERIDEAYAARTLGDLWETARELPIPQAAADEPVPERRPSPRGPRLASAGLLVAAVAIAAGVTGAGFLWLLLALLLFKHRFGLTGGAAARRCGF